MLIVECGPCNALALGIETKIRYPGRSSLSVPLVCCANEAQLLRTTKQIVRCVDVDLSTKSGSSFATVGPTRAYILSCGSVQCLSRCVIRASKRSGIRA